MTDISVQFHALPEELLALVDRFAEEQNAHLLALYFPPFRVERVDREHLAQAFEHPKFYRVAMSLTPPDIDARYSHELIDKNVGLLLFLEIGRRTEAGLEESWLTCRTDDQELLKTWRQFARRLKNITQAGIETVNSVTGATGKDRNHRYSAGAKELYDQGVPILPIAGASRYKLVGKIQ